MLPGVGTVPDPRQERRPSRRPDERIQRSLDAQRAHHQVAVPLRGIGRIGLVVVVHEGQAHAPRAPLDEHLRPILRRSRRLGAHVDGGNRTAIDHEGHAGGLVSGLLAERLGTQPIAPVARKVEDGCDLGRREEDPMSFLAPQPGPALRFEGLPLHGAHGRRIRVLVGHGLGRDALGREQVLLQQDRREGEHVSHPVEAVADVVGGKRLVGCEGHAEEIEHAALVLDAVQAPQGHPGGRRAPARRPRCRQHGGEGAEDALLVAVRRPRLPGRRHVSAPQALGQARPPGSVCPHGIRRPGLVEAQTPLGLRPPVTEHTVGGQERIEDLAQGYVLGLRGSETDQQRQRHGEHEAEAEQDEDGRPLHARESTPRTPAGGTRYGGGQGRCAFALFRLPTRKVRS